MSLFRTASKRAAAFWFAPRPLAYGLGAFSLLIARALWGKALGYPCRPRRQAKCLMQRGAIQMYCSKFTPVRMGKFNF
jgi:hypothetical protein